MLILRDTREKNGWSFAHKDVEVNDYKLDTGDYTVQGIEEDFIIERKATVGELANNITSNAFRAEIQRMANFRHAFLIFEFSWKDLETFPVNSGIPTYLWKKLREKSNFLIGCVNSYRIKYDIQCITADNAEYAEKLAFDLMRRYYENKLRPNKR